MAAVLGGADREHSLQHANAPGQGWSGQQLAAQAGPWRTPCLLGPAHMSPFRVTHPQSFQTRRCSLTPDSGNQAFWVWDPGSVLPESSRAPPGQSRGAEPRGREVSVLGPRWSQVDGGCPALRLMCLTDHVQATWSNHEDGKGRKSLSHSPEGHGTASFTQKQAPSFGNSSTERRPGDQ